MIILKPFTSLDYNRLINWIDSEQLMYIFSATIFKYPINYQQLDNYTKALNRKIYKVIDTHSNNVIGHAELNNIDKRNKSAIKCYQNCGFKIEGLLVENIKIKDDYWSTYNMSIINKI